MSFSAKPLAFMVAFMVAFIVIARGVRKHEGCPLAIFGG